MPDNLIFFSLRSYWLRTRVCRPCTIIMSNKQTSRWQNLELIYECLCTRQGPWDALDK